MTSVPKEKQESTSRAQRVKEWLVHLAPTQITVTPTLAVTLSFTLAVTLAISTYAFVTLVFQDTGWQVAQARASTSYTVLMSQDVVIEENLEVQKNLLVRDDIRILGSVLDMAASDCGMEGLAPPGMVRLCFDLGDDRLKSSASGGDYRDLTGPAEVGGQGPAGPQGPPGPAGPAGRDGLTCWDVNGSGILDDGDCPLRVASMYGVVEIPPPPAAVRPPGPQCVEVPLSRSIVAAAGQDARRVSVQLTPRDQWLPLYSTVRPPLVFICDASGAGGTVDYNIWTVEVPDRRALN